MLFDVEFPPLTGPLVASPPIDPSPVADPPVTGPLVASPPCCACILKKDTSTENRIMETVINEIIIILVNKAFIIAGLNLEIKFSLYLSFRIYKYIESN